MSSEPGKHNIIYLDVPWWYANRNKNTRFGGGAIGHYPLMKDKEVLAMAPQIDELAAENCALCMWATCPRLDFATELIKAYGFRYCTVLLHWVKLQRNGLPIFGPGTYTASNLEVVLLGMRGSLKPVHRLTPSLIMYPRMRHSEKPPIVRDKIVHIFGDLPRIELFARHTAPGWSSQGNQVGALEYQPVLAGWK